MSTKAFTRNQAKVIGERLGVRWERFDVEEFRAGLRVELEHGTVNPPSNVTDDDPLMTGKIKSPTWRSFRLLTRLAKMEKEAKAYWQAKAIGQKPPGSGKSSGNREPEPLVRPRRPSPRDRVKLCVDAFDAPSVGSSQQGLPNMLIGLAAAARAPPCFPPDP